MFLITWIKNLFSSNLAKALQKEWDKLEPDFKNALTTASGIIHIIRLNSDAAPSFVIGLIKKFYPDIIDLQDKLQKLDSKVHGVPQILDNSLETTVKNLQDYLKNKGDIDLSQAAQTLSKIIKPDSVVGKIVTFIELAYQILKPILKF